MKEYQKQKFLEIIIHKWLLKLQVFAILRRECIVQRVWGLDR